MRGQPESNDNLFSQTRSNASFADQERHDALISVNRYIMIVRVDGTNMVQMTTPRP